jgi:hypothetical protein
MRAIITILILAIIVLIGAIATGFLNISQTRQAQAPQVTTVNNGVSAKGGQSPAFRVQTGSLKVGSAETNVKVPVVQVQKPGQQQPATTNAQ